MNKKFRNNLETELEEFMSNVFLEFPQIMEMGCTFEEEKNFIVNYIEENYQDYIPEEE